MRQINIFYGCVWGLLFNLFVFGVPFAVAEKSDLGTNLSERNWLPLTFDNKKPNHFAMDQQGVITVETDTSVSLIYKKVDVDLSKTPFLSWSWRVDQPVPATDLSTKGKDDRSIAVYVSFPFDYERAGFWERFLYDLVSAFKGKDTPGRVISYVWGGKSPVGTIVESPYLKSAGAMVVLKQADTAGGFWRTEKVDIATDYMRLFGQPANRPFQIAISADSDDTKVTSRAQIRDLNFVP